MGPYARVMRYPSFDGRVQASLTHYHREEKEDAFHVVSRECGRVPATGYRLAYKEEGNKNAFQMATYFVDHGCTS